MTAMPEAEDFADTSVVPPVLLMEVWTPPVGTRSRADHHARTLAVPPALVAEVLA